MMMTSSYLFLFNSQILAVWQRLTNNCKFFMSQNSLQCNSDTTEVLLFHHIFRISVDTLSVSAET